MVVKTEYQYIRPPEGLIKRCVMAEYAGTTNGDLLEYAAASIALLSGCNEDNARAYSGYLESLESGE